MQGYSPEWLWLGRTLYILVIAIMVFGSCVPYNPSRDADIEADEAAGKMKVADVRTALKRASSS
ncbi:hypothetical protein T492DRAFT_864379 [Pavlovales sp. CCMP2436]|nr:hypothetical protein T492DRAFT_864379 [Pavlovales sp. CCMP2436]